MKTEKIVKKVIPSGNAGGVYVPKKWINQYVVVTLFRAEDYVLDVFRPFMNDIIGLYMHGSHARGDSCPESDINVLVVAKKEIPYQRKPGLNAEIVLLEALSSYAQASPVDYYSMLNEAVPLMDSGLLEKMKAYSMDDDLIRKFCRDVEISLKMLDHLVSEGDHAAAVYSLMYRLRGLYILHARVRKYTHKGFEEFLCSSGLSREDFYRFYGIYRAKRDDKVVPGGADMVDIDSLLKITGKTLKEIKNIYPKAA
jgi:predicted nucleotidyltransferase